MFKRISALHLAVCALSLTFGSCAESTTDKRDVIYASIAPIKYLVEEIVEDQIRVEVLVPPGASPETFEPTPKQYIALNEARAVMSVGLIEFEESLLSRLDSKSNIVNLSEGIELIEGSCSHDHHHGHHDADEHHHHHGVDPHIWTSPAELQQMALNCYEAIAELYPDSLHYRHNYETLQHSLEQLDTKITGEILAAGTKSFVIYHPAYSYFARAYGLEQIAIEDDGKDPSARRIGQIIERVRGERIGQILYQSQFPASVVEVIAADADAKVVGVDPLSEQIVSHIEEFVSIINRKQ